MQIIIEFLIVFISVYLINYLIARHQNKKLKEDEFPQELAYLSRIYHLKINTADRLHFLKVTSFTNALIIAIVYIIIVYLVKGFIWQILIGLILSILLIIILYGLVARYYEKKGRR